MKNQPIKKRTLKQSLQKKLKNKSFKEAYEHYSAALEVGYLIRSVRKKVGMTQIDLANKVFSPPEAEVNKAKRILEELDNAAKEGKGAAQLDGRMIDAASARMAENIVNINKLIKSK